MHTINSIKITLNISLVTGETIIFGDEYMILLYNILTGLHTSYLNTSNIYPSVKIISCLALCYMFNILQDNTHQGYI